MPVLTTVRHSGSHTALGILEQHFTRHYPTETRQAARIVWFGHTETDKLPLLRQRATEDGPLIATMRHPLDVANSWRRRGLPLDGWFFQMWVNLFSLVDAFDGLWLPMDTPDRDDYLERISEALGVDFETDWTRAGVFYGERSCDGGLSLEEARDWFRGRDEFRQFGYAL